MSNNAYRIRRTFEDGKTYWWNKSRWRTTPSKVYGTAAAVTSILRYSMRGVTEVFVEALTPNGVEVIDAADWLTGVRPTSAQSYSITLRFGAEALRNRVFAELSQQPRHLLLGTPGWLHTALDTFVIEVQTLED